jgi:hypothetical protein
MRQQQDLVTAHSKSSGTSPNFFNTTASENSPTFGSPARLNATAPALAGSRDIPSARLIAAASLWHSCASPGAVTVLGPDEWEQRNRLRPWRPPQQSGHRQCVFFSLPAFGLGAFLTLPRTKPDDTAAERRSISASRNALAINVILKAAMAPPPKLRELIFDRIGGGRDLSVQPVTALTRFSDRS